MSQSQYHPRSPRPICPEAYCGKVWAPDKRTARQLYREIVDETGHQNEVRFYECGGGWHWTSSIEVPRHAKRT